MYTVYVRLILMNLHSAVLPTLLFTQVLRAHCIIIRKNEIALDIFPIGDNACTIT